MPALVWIGVGGGRRRSVMDRLRKSGVRGKLPLGLKIRGKHRGASKVRKEERRGV